MEFQNNKVIKMRVQGEIKKLVTNYEDNETLLKCNGGVLSIDGNEELFEAIGYTFGHVLDENGNVNNDLFKLPNIPDEKVIAENYEFNYYYFIVK